MPTINTKTRVELKNYFRKGFRPTEAQFGELIDAVVNPKDDGLLKSGGTPLQIQADSNTATSLQKVIEFYKSFTDASPAWTVQLKGSGNPITDGLSFQRATTPVLFLGESGRVGIKTNNPAYDLEVNGTVKLGGFLENENEQWPHIVWLRDATVASWDEGLMKIAANQTGNNKSAFGIHFHESRSFNFFTTGYTRVMSLRKSGLHMGTGAIIPKEGPGEDAGIMFSPDVFGGAGDRASIRYFRRGATGESTTLEIKIMNDADDNLDLMASGNVNIGAGGDGTTGTVNIMPRIYAGNSDIYFTRTNHDHTGIGNALGYAAIENGANYNTLMLLGRKGTDGLRRVSAWDVFTVNGTFVNNSDERGKTDIESLQYGLDEVKKLNPVVFNWKSLPNPKKSIGLLAQSVKQVVDEAVYETENPSGHGLGISYICLIPILINAIKELDQKLESAKLQIQQLQS